MGTDGDGPERKGGERPTDARKKTMGTLGGGGAVLCRKSAGCASFCLSFRRRSFSRPGRRRQSLLRRYRWAAQRRRFVAICLCENLSQISLLRSPFYNYKKSLKKVPVYNKERKARQLLLGEGMAHLGLDKLSKVKSFYSFTAMLK